jgi:peptidoglycan lytic transglycosylase G
MRDGQPRGAGVVIVAFLVAALLIGAVWRSAAAGHRGRAAASPGRNSAARTDADEIRHVDIPPGWRAEQIAQALDRSGIGDGGRFLWYVRHPRRAGVPRELASRRSLEGYLAPGGYDIAADFSERRLVVEMTRRFEGMLEPKLRRQAAQRHLSLDTIVTLASIVQREMQMASEAPAIAAVYWNRLRAGMTMSADPTVIYALDTARPKRRPYWAHGLSRRDLDVVSPYNTYRKKGLPPGPIASPGKEALVAALYPADFDYRFFVARGDGTHVFTASALQHLANVRRYRRGNAHPHRAGSDLQRLVERLMGSVDGHVGVFVENLETGETASVNADEFFTSASLYKLAVLVAAFERRERGRLDFGRRLSISARVSAEDHPELQALLGRTPTVRKAIEEMVERSSNAAGVTLLNRLGRASIDRLLRRDGVDATSLASLRIVTTPRDVGRLLELIARGKAVSRRASGQMLQLLLRQKIQDRLPRYLPPRIRLAHKTGTLNYPSHDAGVMYTRSGRILVVAMTEDSSQPVLATDSVARLGRLVYDYFTSYVPALERTSKLGRAACPSNPWRPAHRGPLTGRTIVLDAGHGGADSGAIFRFRDGSALREKDVTLGIALRLKALSTARGATVYLTRCRDVSLTGIQRAALVNVIRPDLEVALHLGSSKDPAADGTAVSYFLPDGKILAGYLLGKFARPALWETLSAQHAIANEGVLQRPALLMPARPSDSASLVITTVPAALAESVDLTNPAEARALRSPQSRRREQIARGHLLGILNYFDADNSPAERGPPWPSAPPAAPPGARVRVEVSSIAREVVAPSRRVSGVVVARVRDLPTPSSAHRLRSAGFTIVDLAGAGGADPDAEARAIAALDRAGLTHTGRPGQMARQQIGPVRVAVIGLPRLPAPAVEAARDLVMRAGKWADAVVVSARDLHVSLARTLVDAGADLVVSSGGARPSLAASYHGRLMVFGLDRTIEIELRGDGTFVTDSLRHIPKPVYER